MMQRIWAVMQKEFIQTVRDRSTLGIMLIMPLLQLVLFAYAINTNVRHIPMVVADQSLDSASRAYIDALVQSGYFDVTLTAPDQAGVMNTIDRGDARAGLVIPPDFAANSARDQAQTLFLVDGSDLFTSISAYNAAAVISQAHSARLVSQRRGPGRGRRQYRQRPCPGYGHPGAVQPRHEGPVVHHPFHPGHAAADPEHGADGGGGGARA